MNRQIILVHGSWQSSWAWQTVKTLLAKQGIKLIVPDLPGHGNNKIMPIKKIRFQHYVETISNLIGQQDTILIGHSFGGMIISQVAATQAQYVKHLIYISGFLPQNQQSLFDCCSLAGINAGLGNHMIINKKENTITLDTNGLDKILFNHCPPSQALAYLNALEVEPLFPLNEKVTVDPKVLATIDKTYIECTADNVIPLALQQAMHRHYHCHLHSLVCDHQPNLSAAQALATLLATLI